MRLVLGPDGAPPIPMLLSLSERAALTAFLRGRPCGKRSGHAMAAADYFPARPSPPFHPHTKKSPPPLPRFSSAPSLPPAPAVLLAPPPSLPPNARRQR